MVHRDLKPSNILVNPETFAVKIIDFGVSKMIKIEKGKSHLKSIKKYSFSSFSHNSSDIEESSGTKEDEQVRSANSEKNYEQESKSTDVSSSPFHSLGPKIDDLKDDLQKLYIKNGKVLSPLDSKEKTITADEKSP